MDEAEIKNPPPRGWWSFKSLEKEIEDIIKKWPVDVAIGNWNFYCAEIDLNENKMHPMKKISSIIHTVDEFISVLKNSPDFNANHEYFQFDNDMLTSFSTKSAYKKIDFDDLVEHIMDNKYSTALSKYENIINVLDKYENNDEIDEDE